MCFFYLVGRKSCTFCTFLRMLAAQHDYSFLLGNICRNYKFFFVLGQNKRNASNVHTCDKNIRKIVKIETKRKANGKNYEHSWWLLQQYLLTAKNKKNTMKSFKKLVKHFNSFIWNVVSWAFRDFHNMYIYCFDAELWNEKVYIKFWVWTTESLILKICKMKRKLNYNISHYEMHPSKKLQRL